MGPGCLASGRCPQWAAWSGGAPGVGKCCVYGELRRAAGPLSAALAFILKRRKRKCFAPESPHCERGGGLALNSDLLSAAFLRWPGWPAFPWGSPDLSSCGAGKVGGGPSEQSLPGGPKVSAPLSPPSLRL